MKTFFSNIQTIIIVVLLVIVLLQQQCSKSTIDFNMFGKGKTIRDTAYVTKIETRWKTIKVDSIVYVPKWRVKTDTVNKTKIILKDVDTAAILRDYYATYFYPDTLNLDTLGKIVISDSVTQNTIISRSIQPNLTIPERTIYRDSIINKREFYAGIGLAGTKQQFNYIGGELLYRSKRKQVIGIGAGINQDLQPVLSGRLMWKLGN